jgi:hypothetical protein
MVNIKMVSKRILSLTFNYHEKGQPTKTVIILELCLHSSTLQAGLAAWWPSAANSWCREAGILKTKCSTEIVASFFHGQTGQLAISALHIFQTSHLFHAQWHGTVGLTTQANPKTISPSPSPCWTWRRAFPARKYSVKAPWPSHGSARLLSVPGVPRGYAFKVLAKKILPGLKSMLLVLVEAHGNNHNSESNCSKSLK